MPSTRLSGRLTLDDFLCFDFNGPTGVTVAPDGSRSNFFHHMGLREQSFRHRQLYDKMKREAVAGMGRLFKSRKSLHPEIAEDESIIPPYSVTQITEVAFRQQVEMIYDTASRQTRGIYDLTRTDHEGNWVIRWMLWRVIQARQKQLQRSDGETEVTEAMNETLAPRTPSSMQGIPGRAASPAWTAAESCESTDMDDASTAKLYPHIDEQNVEAGLRSRYWDHVLSS